MFYGDDLLVRFLNELPHHLRQGGKAIIGMNSLVGIQDVIARHIESRPNGPKLHFRLVERHTMPLLFYTDAWKSVEPHLKAEFFRWRENGGSAFSMDGDNRLFWSYEIVEVSVKDRLPC